MVLSDTSTHLSECADLGQVKYGDTVEENPSFYEPIIHESNSRSSLVTGEHSLWDYRFMPYALSHASPQTEKNIKYLLTRVEHHVEQQRGYRSEVSKPEKNPYTNAFHARPITQSYRKAKILPKPRVNSVITGKVVTSAGDWHWKDDCFCCHEKAKIIR
jgi:uncharacterized protein involved in type VI secretion and phage assembly